MADLDPQQLAALSEGLRQGRITAEDFAKTILATNSALTKFGSMSIKNVVGELTKLEKQVKTGEKSYKDLNGSLQYYKKQIDEATSGKEKELAQQKLNELANKSYRETLIAGAKQVGVVLVTGLYDYYKQQVMTGIRGLQGDGSPFQVAADLQTSAIDSVANTTAKLGGVFSQVGQSLMAIPTPATMVAGALVSLAGDLFSAGAKEAAELLKFKLEVVSKELEKSYKSFQQATAAGALFAGGMTELRNVGLAAGLTQEQFSKVIADNSLALATFGNDVTMGAKKLSGVLGKLGEGTNSTRQKLLNLGISVEDQAQGTADYLAMLQRGNVLKGKSDEELAAGTKDYLVQLKAIASFTGEDAKKAEARAREASAQAAVQAKLQDLGADSQLKFENAIKQLPAPLQKAAQQMLAFGKVIDPELARTLGPTATKLLQDTIGDVTDAGVSSESAIDNFQNNLRANAEALQGEAKRNSEIFGTVALANGQYAKEAETAASLLVLANKSLRGEFGQTTLDTAKKAMDTLDPLTQGVTKSVDALQNMRQAIQGDLTKAITDFAEDVPEILAEFRAKLQKLGLLEGGGPGARPIVKATEESAKEAIVAATGAKPETITAEAIAAQQARMDVQTRIEENNARRAARRAANAQNIKASRPEEVIEEITQQATGGILKPRNGGQLVLAAEAGMHEAFVPLPDGKSIPVNMSTELKQALMDNNTLIASFVRDVRDLMTSTAFRESSEKQEQMVELMNKFVELQQDASSELRDQTSSLKKIYEAYA